MFNWKMAIKTVYDGLLAVCDIQASDVVDRRVLYDE